MLNVKTLLLVAAAVLIGALARVNGLHVTLLSLSYIANAEQVNGQDDSNSDSGGTEDCDYATWHDQSWIGSTASDLVCYCGPSTSIPSRVYTREVANKLQYIEGYVFCNVDEAFAKAHGATAKPCILVRANGKWLAPFERATLPRTTSKLAETLKGIR